MSETPLLHDEEVLGEPWRVLLGTRPGPEPEPGATYNSDKTQETTDLGSF